MSDLKLGESPNMHVWLDLFYYFHVCVKRSTRFFFLTIEREDTF